MAGGGGKLTPGKEREGTKRRRAKGVSLKLELKGTVSTKSES